MSTGSSVGKRLIGQYSSLRECSGEETFKSLNNQVVALNIEALELSTRQAMEAIFERSLS